MNGGVPVLWSHCTERPAALYHRLKNAIPYGLFRQNGAEAGAGTGTGNLTNTNGFLDTMLSLHSVTGVGLGLGLGT